MRHRRSPRVSAAGLFLVVIAALFGVFAMHSLAPHQHTAAVATLVGGAKIADDLGYGAHSDLEHVPHAALSGDAAPNDDQEGQGHGQLAEICLAFLTLLLAVFLLMAVVRAKPHRPMVIFKRARERLVICGIPTQRPCLKRLSILRC